MIELETPRQWENMQDEYGSLNLYPSGHIMARMRSRLGKEVLTSRDISTLPENYRITTAGLVIRRQRPHSKVVFITLEDEFGHIPCMVFPKVFDRWEYQFKSPILIVRGKLSRREDTFNVIVEYVKPLSAQSKIPPSKDWH